MIWRPSRTSGGELARAEAGVEVDHVGADLGRGHLGDHEGRGVAGQQRDGATVLHAERRQAVGHGVGAPVQLRVAEPLALVDHREPVGPAGGRHAVCACRRESPACQREAGGEHAVRPRRPQQPGSAQHRQRRRA
jgi:hypothetical protein